MNIEEILNFVEKSLSAKDENVMKYFLERDISQSSSKEYSQLLGEIVKWMEKPYSDKTPREIWLELGEAKETFPYRLGMAEYYCLYYYSILDTVFKSKLEKNIHNFLNQILMLDWQLDGKSSFHNHSGELKITLDSRKEKIKKVQEIRYARSKRLE